MLIGAAVLVAVVTVGGVAWARSGSPAAYRTAVVSRGPVTATLELVGTVQPAQAATVGFAQSGTVASVDVAVGQSVTAGQAVAQLDLTTLRGKLAQAQATEAAARLTLTQAENGTLPAGAGGTASGGSSPSATRTAATGTGSGGTVAAQQAVTAAQKAVDAASKAAQQQLSATSTACGSGPPAAGPSTRGGAATAGAAPAAGTAAGDPGGCLAAESALLQAEQALAGRQTTLTTAQAALAKALTSSGSASGAGAGGTTVSAAQLAEYRAALDAATAAVGAAQQALDQGTAVSPLTGTVVSVGLLPGQAVTAASSTAVVEVAVPGGYQVTTTVPTAQVGRVAAGQHATVTPDGGGGLTATVASVGAVPGSSGYPVVLALGPGTPGLHVGSSAAVTLTTATVASAVVVPTSAVRTVGTRHVVEVLTGGAVAPVAVTTGATGPLRTQVLSGLQVGQQVVLADLSSTVTSDSSTTGGTTGGFGGAGGRFAGGAPGQRAGRPTG